MADIENIVRLESIDTSNFTFFSTIADVMNACFGKNWIN